MGVLNTVSCSDNCLISDTSQSVNDSVVYEITNVFHFNCTVNPLRVEWVGVKSRKITSGWSCSNTWVSTYEIISVIYQLFATNDPLSLDPVGTDSPSFRSCQSNALIWVFSWVSNFNNWNQISDIFRQPFC